MYACTPSAWPGVLRVQKVELEMVLSCLPCAPYVNSGPLKEQCVLLTAEPSLQPWLDLPRLWLRMHAAPAWLTGTEEPSATHWTPVGWCEEQPSSLVSVAALRTADRTLIRRSHVKFPPGDACKWLELVMHSWSVAAGRVSSPWERSWHVKTGVIVSRQSERPQGELCKRSVYFLSIDFFFPFQAQPLVH